MSTHLHKSIQTWSHTHTKILCAHLRTLKSACKRTCREGLNLVREKKAKMCGLIDYPIHLSILLHTWLPPQNMPSAFHSTERWGTKQRWKTQYHSCINYLACVCSAWDSAQLFTQLSVITCVYIHTCSWACRHTRRHTQPSASQRNYNVDRQAKRQGQKLADAVTAVGSNSTEHSSFSSGKRCLCIF